MDTVKLIDAVGQAEILVTEGRRSLRHIAHVKDFDEKLKIATARVEPNYFKVRRWNAKETYRERAYSYELFHQLRVLWFWKDPGNPFVLHGELDKNGHLALKRLGVKGSKPDLLVHVPTWMDHNYAIIEVKSSNAAPRGIRKDLETLSTFVRDVGYKRAIYLLYGKDRDQTVSKVEAVSREVGRLAPIELWWHGEARESAQLAKTLKGG